MSITSSDLELELEEEEDDDPLSGDELCDDE